LLFGDRTPTQFQAWTRAIAFVKNERGGEAVHSHRLLIRSESAPKNDPIDLNDLNEGDLVEGDERREKEKEMKEYRNPKAASSDGWSL
jgi:hypothetical protein